MDSAIAIYIGIGLAMCALVLVGRLRSRRNPKHHGTGENLLNAIIERQSPGSKCQLAGRSPQQHSVLEGHWPNAILDANARERLLQDIMRASGCGRQEAIRKVLRDYVRHADLFK